MDAPEIFPVQGHIPWVIPGIRAKIRSRCIRGGIAVLYPSVFGVQDQDIFIYRMQAFPIGFGIAAVNRLGIVINRIPDRDKIPMKIGDVTIGIGVYGIVRRIGADIHHLTKSIITVLFGSDIRLLQGFCRFPHHARCG